MASTQAFSAIELARANFAQQGLQGRFEVASEIYAKDFVNHGATSDVGLKEDQDAARGWKAADDEWGYGSEFRQELLADSEQKIARPRQVFTGSPRRSYVPIEKR